MNTKISDAAVELLPCPFCGGEATFKVGYHMMVDVKVGCDECYAEGPIFGTDARDGDFRSQAANAWNSRNPHPQPAALNEVSGNSGELGGDERARFEAWADRADLSCGRFNDGGYCDERTVSAWLAWLAALAATGKQQGGEVQEPVLYQIREEIIGKDSLGSTNLKVKEKLNSWREISKSHYDAYVSVMGGRGPMGVLGHPDGPVALELNRYNPKVEVRALYAAQPAHSIDLSSIATRKLGELAAQGYVTNGVAIFNPATGHRGLLDNLGFVGWMGAQGIDLGQFRDLIGFAVLNAIYLPESDPRRDFIRQANDLLALIDSQRAAGAGVES